MLLPPALRLRPLSEWRLPDGTSGASIQLLWQGPDGFWRGIFASGRNLNDAEAHARRILAEALARWPGGAS